MEWGAEGKAVDLSEAVIHFGLTIAGVGRGPFPILISKLLKPPLTQHRILLEPSTWLPTFGTLSAKKVVMPLYGFQRGCEKEACTFEDAWWMGRDIDKTSAAKKDELRCFPPPIGSGSERSRNISPLVPHTVLPRDDSQVWFHRPDKGAISGRWKGCFYACSLSPSLFFICSFSSNNY